MLDDDVVSPWHDGELALQRHEGVAEAMDRVGRRAIRPALTEQHRLFYPLLPFVVLGSVDGADNPWATLRAAPRGFLSAPDASQLHAAIPAQPDDPAEPGLSDGKAVGLLGIDLTTRRRNRLNGVVRRSDSTGFDIEVRQAFGNCPKYIQGRQPRFAHATASPPTYLDRLDGAAIQIVIEADTFFVASYADLPGGERQVDVSHRGGRPGFVRVDPDGTLTIPDFSGNRFFSTLGNMLLTGKAGLVFVEFTTGELLQMTGDAALVLDGPDVAGFEGAERLWRFHPRQIVRRPGAMSMRWSFANDWSPSTVLTGTWPAQA
ncbi:pyridoxamine 5'-phosphate oxidase family protein [Acidisphaera sp. L21]|uniref:pyridoxamine 5'-phosphate oxidase family protein n=1 Tax=Acidisphaera sp. L21 TaxID=1641851 RepID=UPI00131DFCD5|nr:pyridoxamine 5'-phosphate oxidase family protein [Acidisphaera sp. L21]